MKIDLKQLPPGGGAAGFAGKDPPSALAWDFGARDVIRPAGPMEYDLKARLVGTTLLAAGSAGADFSGTCCRCGGALRRRYTAEISIEREVDPAESCVDLTSDLRESILLALPNHPICSDECPGPAPAARPGGGGKGRECAPSDSPWGALDAMFGGTTHDNARPRKKKTGNQGK